MGERTYRGSCFCGEVRLDVSGEPVAQGFCHCGDCRAWSAAPVNAFTLWKPESVRITKGAEHVRVYEKTERSLRKFCDRCGGHVLTEHPHWNLLDVYTAVIPELRHQPAVHVHYAETVLPMKDGLPKMRDLPKEMGGSGLTIAE
jgi:hypothetical protein